MPAFRFLHASDFHLERPPAGLAELPDHLRDILVEAPYAAAANVFDAALAHEVDFVLLAGDILAPKLSGPRSILFLNEQFKRLAERNIGVYWVGGTVDQVNDWPKAIHWPANVHIFAAEKPEQFQVIRHGQQLCRIIGQSLPPNRQIDPRAFMDQRPSLGEDGFTIGLLHVSVDDPAIDQPKLDFHTGLPVAHRAPRPQIDYWALGGEHEPTLPQEVRPVVHFPGSPQGRSRLEIGPHGCTLVEVSVTSEIRTVPLVTDVVRFAHERLTLPSFGQASAGDNLKRISSEIERLLGERMKELVGANPAVTLVVDFTFDGEPILQATRLSLPMPTIIGVLRGEFGYRTPPAWLSRIHFPPPQPSPQNWLEQETLLGDVLRAAYRLQQSDEPVELDRYLPTGPRREAICDFIAMNQATRQQAISEATALAASLLSPEEARP